MINEIDIETRLKDSTSKLSDIYRTLALTFIGIIWIINGELFPLSCSSKIQLVLISISLLIDIVQYLLIVVLSLIISHKRKFAAEINNSILGISYFCLFLKISLLIVSGILIVIEIL